MFHKGFEPQPTSNRYTTGATSSAATDMIAGHFKTATQSQPEISGQSQSTELVPVPTSPKQVGDVIELGVSRSHGQDSPNLDNPFRLFRTVNLLRVAITNLAKNHGLNEHVDLLKSAAEHERDDVENEERIPDDETRQKKSTFSNQTRSLKVAVLVVGLLSASCQGWNQSVLNGTGMCYRIRHASSSMDGCLCADTSLPKPPNSPSGSICMFEEMIHYGIRVISGIMVR